MVKLLYNYKSQGIDSTQAIISRYAPSTENNTASYINTVATKIGKEPGQALTTANDYKALISAMIQVESGNVPDQSTVALIVKYLQSPVVQEISVAALAIGAAAIVWFFFPGLLSLKRSPRF
jgi:hypothetical protein